MMRNQSMTRNIACMFIYLYIAAGAEGGSIEVSYDAGLAEAVQALYDGGSVYQVPFAQVTR